MNPILYHDLGPSHLKMTSFDLRRRLSEARGLDGPATEWSFQARPFLPLFRAQEDDHVSYPTLPPRTADGVGEGAVMVRKVPQAGRVRGPERLCRFYPGV